MVTGTQAVVAATAAIIVIAAAASLRSAPAPQALATTRAAEVPAALAIGDPRRLPAPTPGAFNGRIVWVDASCRLHVFELASAATRRLAGEACGLGAGSSRYVAAGSIRVRAVDVVTGRSGASQRRAGPSAASRSGWIATCGRDRVAVRAGAGTVARFPGCSPVFVGDRLFVISPDRGAVRSPRSGRTVIRARRGAQVQGFAADAGGRVLAAVITPRRGGGGTVVVVRLRDGHVLARRALGRSSQPSAVAIGGRPRVAAVQLRGPAEWALIDLHDVRSLAVIGGNGIRAAAISPDGRWAAAVTLGAVVLVDTATLAPVAAIPGNALQVAWQP